MEELYMKRLLSIVGILCMMMGFTSYAEELSWENVPGNHNVSILLEETEVRSKNEYHTVARGDFLSAGITEIINGQDGTIGINIDTYAHCGVDRIFHTVFLDQWDETEQDWNQVGYWNFVRTKDEEEDGVLNSFLTSFNVSGYETGMYYRIRGLHGAEYNDEVEACASETHGILITDGPT